jgi:hypothetical protein
MNRVYTFLFVGLGALGIVFAVFVALMWWGSRIPKRPADISPSGIFIERGSVPFEFSMHGDWLDCWQDVHTNTDECRLTDEKGVLKYEGTFLSYGSKALVPGSELKMDAVKTGHLWIGVTVEKIISIPVIFLQNGVILLPQNDYDVSSKSVDFWVYGRAQ